MPQAEVCRVAHAAHVAFEHGILSYPTATSYIFGMF